MKKLLMTTIYFGLIALLTFICTNITGAYAVTTIDKCGVLSIPGETYYVIKDIVHTQPGNCITINANDITLDCKDFTISGNAGSKSGIRLYLTNGVTIKNCIVQKFRTGIRDLSGISNKIEQNTVRYNSDVGMSLSGTDGMIFRNTAHDNEASGFSVQGSSNYIYNNRSISNMANGFIIAGTGNHIVTKNLAKGNKRSGILVNQTESNQISKNRTNSNANNGIYVLGNSTGNLIYANSSEKNNEHGFKDNTLVNNKVKNKYIRNRCLDNLSGGSVPSKLCKPQP